MGTQVGKHARSEGVGGRPAWVTVVTCPFSWKRLLGWSDKFSQGWRVFRGLGWRGVEY
jgi:hypothetical protein